jgi:hypothetical protein
MAEVVVVIEEYGMTLRGAVTSRICSDGKVTITISGSVPVAFQGPARPNGVAEIVNGLSWTARPARRTLLI